MTYAGLIDANPCSRISKVFPKTGVCTLTPNQLPELMNKLAKASISLQTRLLIEWSSCSRRPSEAAGATWVKLTAKQTLANPSRTDEEAEAAQHSSYRAELGTTGIVTISGHREFLFPGQRDPMTQHQRANS